MANPGVQLKTMLFIFKKLLKSLVDDAVIARVTLELRRKSVSCSTKDCVCSLIPYSDRAIGELATRSECSL